MKYPVQLLLVLVLIPQICRAGAEPSSVPTPASAGVTLRFHNGSVVQPALLLEPIEMETKFGKISIPANEVRRIDFGFRLSEDDARKVENALRDLGNDGFQAREAASKTLLELGRQAYPSLIESRKNKDPEISERVETLLKEIRDRVPAERLHTRRHDIVRTSDSMLAGQITSPALRIRSELFGEVKIQAMQLRELRSTMPGGELAVSLDSSKHGTRSSWMATDYEVASGSRLEISVSGEINLDPTGRVVTGGLGQKIRPDGQPQLTSGEDFVPGQVVGRIGNDGQPFLVGSRYSGVSEREGKLFLRIATIEHANQIKAAGSYQVRISAEAN